MPELLSTYRIQLTPAFGFDQAAEICPYLKALGITHVYCSPYLQAAPGSTHGYDVVDPGRVNEELGGAEAHARFLNRLREEGLGQVLDIVPNHMAIADKHNRWWWDVLENGPLSVYASWFDIDWQSPEEKLRDKILAPVLGDHYGRVLAAGRIRLAREEGSFVFHCEDHEYPAAPQSMAPLLADAARRIQSDYLAFLAYSLARLPQAASETLFNGDRSAIEERHRDKEVIRGLLARLCAESPDAARSIDASVERVNRDPDMLDELLEHQSYRLAYWRTAARDMAYRRFFDINSLVGLRMERPEVFDSTHRLILEWVRSGDLHGLRVDHPDGLRDPEGYFERLHNAAPEAWIAAEKILEPGESLRRSWMANGTTGYDFLNVLSGLFVDRRGEEALTRFYRAFTGETDCWEEVAIRSKELVLRDILGSDLNRLTAMFVDICERHRDNRDFTRHDIHNALRGLVAAFPVYRTYVRAEQGQSAAEDEQFIDRAVELVKGRYPDTDNSLLDFLHSILLLKKSGDTESEFVMQFQQFTGPAMAKGVEDTAFYNYNRLLCLNEVGGDPGDFGTTPEEFHSWCERMSRDWPRTMLTTSTHDTKRGEDVRIRIALLAGMPDQWREAVLRWSVHTEHLKAEGSPDKNTEYGLYQTLVGAWPIETPRLVQYAIKAVREAKRGTSWAAPNAEFEQAVENFVTGMMGDAEFLEDARAFIEPLIGRARVLSLAQTLIRLTAPGVPDTYQGTELWDLNLVDPDNRRPVDYDLRRELLNQMDSMEAGEILTRMDSGLPKLWVMKQALHIRARLGAYVPLAITGELKDSAIAFSRGEAVTIVPRFPVETACWKDTSAGLPEGKWKNILTGEEIGENPVLLRSLFAKFPVALLALAG